MKTFLKVLLYIILVVIVGAGAFFGYLYFSKGGERNAWSVIPSDAVFIIETKNLNKGWNMLSNSKIWEHLMANEYFSDINEDAMYADSMLTDNDFVGKMLKDRQLVVSAHIIPGPDFDFLFVIDVEKASLIPGKQTLIEQFGYTVNDRKVEGGTILEMMDDESREILYVAFVENLLVGSYTRTLVEDALLEKDDKYWINQPNFLKVKDEISSGQMFNFYFNYAILPEYLKIYLSEESETINSLADAMAFSALNITLDGNRLGFTGYSNINDSISSYIKALSQIEPGRMGAYNIISDQAAMYLSICFEDFDQFFNKLQGEYAASNEEDFESYSGQLSKIEKWFKINIQKHFFSWIGNEIALVKLKPTTAGAREEDVVVVIQTRDMGIMDEGLSFIAKQVKRRSPVKFKTVHYRNFEINYLEMKGFFKLLFGKLFDKLERPYYTYIEDYAVFCNSQKLLQNFIDDYVEGRTLSHREKFMDFKNEFSDKANLSVFIQTPKIYQHIYFYGKDDAREGIRENKDLILSFARIGFQLVNEGDVLKTTLFADHDEEALLDEELEKMEKEVFNQINTEYFDSLAFKPDIPEPVVTEDGLYKSYYTDSVIKFEGNIADGQPEGLWRSYYQSGSIMSTVNYEDGKANGTAKFFYDNVDQTVKAEVVFEDDKIIDVYKEFYDNGARKANIEYKNGVKHGDALFFYMNGAMKIEGKYKNGKKRGKWKFYDEDGEIYNKERMKKRKKGN